MAFKLTNVRPFQGLNVETGNGVILASTAWFGISVSTTHAMVILWGLAPQKGTWLPGGVWVRKLLVHGSSQFQLVQQLLYMIPNAFFDTI